MPAPAVELEKVSLQLVWKHQFQFAGYYVAKAKGFYQQAGLDVEIREYDTNISPTSEILASRADFAVGRSSILIDKAKGKDIVALFSAYQDSPLMLLALESSGISKPEDLVGKRIMMTSDAAQVAEVMAMLLQTGIQEGDYSRLQHSFQLSDLISGKTDAMASYLSNEPYQLEQLNIPYKIVHPRDYGFNMYSDILFTSGERLRNFPDQVARFYEASIKGWLYAFEHLEETTEIILAHYNSQQRSRAALLYEGQALRKLAFDNQGQFGTITSESISSMLSIYLITRQIDSSHQLEDFIYQPLTNGNQFSAGEQHYIQENPIIKLCVDPEWMPYEGIENNQHTGIVADYLKLIMAKAGLQTEIITSKSWISSQIQIRRGDCSILSGAMQTPSRGEYLNFTKPYMSMPAGMIVKDSLPSSISLPQLLQRPIAVVEGYAFKEILQNRYPTIQFTEVMNIEAGLRLVQNGQVGSFIDAPASIQKVMYEANLKGLSFSNLLHDTWDISIAVSINEPILLGILNKAISQISFEEQQNIMGKWINAGPYNSIDYKILWQLIAVLLVVFGVIIYRYRLISQHNEKLKDIAQRDRLTGIYNRHKLYHRFEKMVSLNQRYQRPASIIFFDIDNFKQVNDQYGHQIGDETLKTIALLVKQNLREQDCFGRWGGEEFIAILPEIKVQEAIRVARKLRTIIEQHPIIPQRPVTCSFGVAEYIESESIEHFISRADVALYRAKSEGKNREIKAEEVHI